MIPFSKYSILQKKQKRQKFTPRSKWSLDKIEIKPRRKWSKQIEMQS